MPRMKAQTAEVFHGVSYSRPRNGLGDLVPTRDMLYIIGDSINMDAAAIDKLLEFNNVEAVLDMLNSKGGNNVVVANWAMQEIEILKDKIKGMEGPEGAAAVLALAMEENAILRDNAKLVESRVQGGPGFDALAEEGPSVWEYIGQPGELDWGSSAAAKGRRRDHLTRRSSGDSVVEVSDSREADAAKGRRGREHAREQLTRRSSGDSVVLDDGDSREEPSPRTPRSPSGDEPGSPKTDLMTFGGGNRIHKKTKRKKTKRKKTKRSRRPKKVNRSKRDPARSEYYKHRRSIAIRRR